MSKVIEVIKALVSKSIKVEAHPINNYGQYPVTVTDIVQDSATFGWALTYYPKLVASASRLYDGKEALTKLMIANFSAIFNTVLSIDQRFHAGDQVSDSQYGKRAEYLYGEKAKFIVSQRDKTTLIQLNVIDEKSPFHMLSISFRVIDSNKEAGVRHLIGSEDRWDRNADTFNEGNAILSPDKQRCLRVYQDDRNSVPFVKAPGRIVGSKTEVDPHNSEYIYLQDVSNSFRALAVIYEKAILETAMEQAFLQVQAIISAAASQPAADGFGGQQAAAAFGAAANNAPFGAPAGAPQESEAAEVGGPKYNWAGDGKAW